MPMSLMLKLCCNDELKGNIPDMFTSATSAMHALRAAKLTGCIAEPDNRGSWRIVNADFSPLNNAQRERLERVVEPAEMPAQEKPHAATGDKASARAASPKPSKPPVARAMPTASDSKRKTGAGAICREIFEANPNVSKEDFYAACEVRGIHRGTAQARLSDLAREHMARTALKDLGIETK